MPTFLANLFANPLLAYGALAGSIPVAIHLLNRQRFKKVVWAAMHWLWASYKKSQRRLQIEQLILLLVRILVLVLLALALAHPILQQGMGLLAGRASTHRVIVLDNSFSMGQAVSGHPMFDKAKDLANELATKLTLSDEFDVIVSNNIFDETIATSAARNQNVTASIKGATISDGGTDIPKSIAAACRIFNERKTANLRREIIVITDQTRSAWETADHQPRRVTGADEEMVARAFSDPKSRPVIRVIRLEGNKDPENIAVTGIEVDEKVVSARTDTQFVATLQSYGFAGQKEVRVKLKVDGEEVASETAKVSAGKTESVHFRYSFPEAGSHAITVELPEDALPNDNTAFLAVDVEDQMRVLCVDGQQRVGPNASEMDYFRQALSPDKSEEVHAGKMPLFPEVIGDSALFDAPLENYRLVVLANVASILPEKIKALEQYVRLGGSLLIFTGEKVIPSIYNKELAELLPMDLGELVGNDDAEPDTGQALSDKEIGHPAIAKFKGIRGLKLSELRTARHFKLLPKSQSDPSVRTVLAFESGELAAVEKTLGEGRIILVGTTANGSKRSGAWNNWGAKFEYLPLMNYLALDLIQPAYVQRNRGVGEKFAVQLPRQDLGAARREGVRLVDPSGETSAMEIVTEQSRIESAQIRKAGVYTAEIPGDTKRTLHFAANRPADESDLSTMEDREVLTYIPRAGETGTDRASYFKALINQDDFALAPEDSNAVEESLKKAGGSREIWRWLAYTVLGLLLAESLLARRFGNFSR